MVESSASIRRTTDGVTAQFIRKLSFDHPKSGPFSTFQHQTCYFWLWGVEELGSIEESILQLIQWHFVFTPQHGLGISPLEGPYLIHPMFCPWYILLYGLWSPFSTPNASFCCLGDLPALSRIAADFAGRGVSSVIECRESSAPH